MAGPRIAVVGRRFGTRVQVPALRAAGFDVVALVGRDTERTAHKAGKLGIPNVCGSLTEALELPEVDAVAIATPPDTHFALALEALEAGRHVLCEKPFTSNAEQAAQLVAAAARAGVVGALGHEFRWTPARAAVGGAIASGAIGSPRLATIVEYNPFLTKSGSMMPSWFEEPGIGGWLGANGSHTLDQIRQWLGPFESVSASMLTASDQGRRVEDAYSARFHMGSGTEAVLQQIGAAWTTRSLIAVSGTLGTAGIDDGQAWIADAEGTRDLDQSAGSAPVVDGAIDNDDFAGIAGFEIRLYQQLAAAFGAAIEGRPTTSPVPLPTFADGLDVMRCIDAIRASSAQGGALVTINGG